MTKNNFMWAQGKDANLMEPLKELSENGWRIRDIPKASNMNWIFKQISDEFATLRKDLQSQTTELHQKLSEQSQAIQEHKETINTLKTELGSLSEKHIKLKTYTKNHLIKAFRRDEYNNGISMQICQMLKDLEANIRAYHPNFPEFPWPVKGQMEVEAEDESVEINSHD